MLNHIKEKERRYVTLDDGNARRLAERDPALFFETYGYPLLIDEFQRVPSILPEMKRIVDQKALAGEDNNGMYWLTGSQKFKMMKDVSESLAGRIAVFDMSGLSAAELEGRKACVFHPAIEKLRERMQYCSPGNVHEIYEQIFRGGMPKLIVTNMDRERFYTDYINTYLERDIDGKEIDLLFVEGDRIYPVEIKKAKMPNHADKNFSVLNKLKMDVQTGVIVCMADEMLPYSHDVWYFPVAGV